MKLQYSRLFISVVQCVGPTGLMKYIQQFAEADSKNQKVLEELYKVHYEFARKHERMYNLLLTIRALGLIFVIVGALVLSCSLFSFPNAMTPQVTFTSLIVVVIGAIMIAWYIQLYEQHKYPYNDFPTITFCPEKYPALARYVQFHKYLIQEGLISSISDSRNDISELKEEVERFAVTRVRTFLETTDCLDSNSLDSEWDKLEALKKETFDVLKFFSSVGYWHSDWRGRLEDIKAAERERRKKNMATV